MIGAHEKAATWTPLMRGLLAAKPQAARPLASNAADA